MFKKKSSPSSRSSSGGLFRSFRRRRGGESRLPLIRDPEKEYAGTQTIEMALRPGRYPFEELVEMEGVPSTCQGSLQDKPQGQRVEKNDKLPGSDGPKLVEIEDGREELLKFHCQDIPKGSRAAPLGGLTMISVEGPEKPAIGKSAKNPPGDRNSAAGKRLPASAQKNGWSTIVRHQMPSFHRCDWEDTRGLRVTSGAVTLQKDANNLVGISIGGGAPMCPCLYIVQIFDKTPAAECGVFDSGDEITGVNKIPVKGKTKTEVARMIQSQKGEVTLQYNKLHAEQSQGKTLDIILKKMKHKMVENMSQSTADALGLSRAILCNDSMVKKLNELEANATMYRGLMEHSKKLTRAYFRLSNTYKQFGDIFAEIGAREPHANASEAFTTFGNAHRDVEKNGMKLIKILKPILADLTTYLFKAIPDTKLTIKKYLDAKFEYLSYCLKIKELDDEEIQFNALQEPLYRVETGNYEYRLVLRCRQLARAKFAKLRSDCMVKMELLDQKHVQDIVFQLQRFVAAMARYHKDCQLTIEPTRGLFPIEVDLSQVAVKYNTTGQLPTDGVDDDDLTDNESEDPARQNPTSGDLLGSDPVADSQSASLAELMGGGDSQPGSQPGGAGLDALLNMPPGDEIGDVFGSASGPIENGGGSGPAILQLGNELEDLGIGQPPQRKRDDDDDNLLSPW